MQLHSQYAPIVIISTYYSWTLLYQVYSITSCHSLCLTIQNNLTPLHYASQEGQCSVVKCLITSGTDINAVDNVSCILYVVSILIMIMITIQKRATPLHHAAIKGHELVVEHLLKNGADINLVDKVHSKVAMHIVLTIILK